MATPDPRSSGDRMWAQESRFSRSAEVTSVDIPAEALTPGAPETKVEVLAREKSGNQTITEVPFSVK